MVEAQGNPTDFASMNDHDLLVHLATRFDAVERLQAADSKRIDSLERWRWTVVGIASGASAVGGFLGGSVLIRLLLGG